MNKPWKALLMECPACGAECRDKKDYKRFVRRHPETCTSRSEFNKQLAQETKAVDADDKAFARYVAQGAAEIEEKHRRQTREMNQAVNDIVWDAARRLFGV